MTSQTAGPYTDAAVMTPDGDASRRRTQADLATISPNTADYQNATPTCISTPSSAVGLPPSSAFGPISVAATP